MSLCCVVHRDFYISFWLQYDSFSTTTYFNVALNEHQVKSLRHTNNNQLIQIILYIITTHKITHKLNYIHNEGAIINKALRQTSEDEV